MSSFSFLNETTLRIYRYKYKSFGTPIISIFVCTILFFLIIVPQFDQWLLMQQEIAISEQRVNVLTNNLTFASKINGDSIDKYLQLVSRALPTNKDFIGILTAISTAAIDSAVALNDYSFQVGDLSGPIKGNLGNLLVTISINGGLNDLKRFAISLKKQLPLSDITEIHLDGGNTAYITITFYYKPFPDKISFQPSKPLQTLSSNEQTLLENLIAIDNSSKLSTLSIQEQLIKQ